VHIIGFIVRKDGEIFSTTVRLNENGQNRMWLAGFMPKSTYISDHTAKDLSIHCFFPDFI
jgi:hypothetical protein